MQLGKDAGYLPRPHQVWLAWLAVCASALLGCSSAVLDRSGSALSIINRPDRAQDEREAWHPDKLEDLSALLRPPATRGKAFPVIDVPLPTGGVGAVFWMDKRYVLTTFISRDLMSHQQTEARIQVIDAQNGQVYDYKEGGLECYQEGKILYKEGPSLAFMRPDVGGAKYHVGEILKEVERDAWIPATEGQKSRRYTYNRHDCALNDPLDLEAKQNQIGGTFYASLGKRTLPVWSPFALQAEHGQFALHLPSVWASQETLNAAVGFHAYWLKPNGEKVHLDLAYPQEIGGRDHTEWVPWLGQYVFSGTGISYSNAPGRTETSQTAASLKYGLAGNLIIFNPETGGVTKSARPSYFLNNVQVRKAYATRAGLLWQSGTGQPWGVYLSNGDDVLKIAPHHVSEISVSPDGCRAAIKFFSKPGQFDSPMRLQIFHFC